MRSAGKDPDGHRGGSDDKGTSFGVVKLREDGTAYGFGPFLTRRGADEDDIMILQFDLADGVAVLRLGDDELLEEMNPSL